MKVSAVISEFNPFHYGHKYLIDNIRNKGTTHIVAVMSGNFVQRGEPAIISKWDRARMAIMEGIDLVIEIPTPWSVSTAERYAYAGVKIADSMGCVDYLEFASECGDLDLLLIISNLLFSNELKLLLCDYLKLGITYAKAREKSVMKLLGNRFSDVIKEPNNILAIEYLKAIRSIGSGIKPRTIRRVGTKHDSSVLIGNVDCASSIRRKILGNDVQFKNFIPNSTYEILLNKINCNMAPADINYVERSILCKLRSMDLEQICNLPDISEGMEYRIFEAISKAKCVEDVYKGIKSKRYTLSRIRRIILSAFLGLNSQYGDQDVPYIKVLGFNNKGTEVLNLVKKKGSLPLITKYSDVKKLSNRAKEVYNLECKCTDIYNMMLPDILEKGKEMTNKIIIL